ncbi:unnamed protein product [Tetraodon nigroviridis]|uniref:(spotted green pufferfish) hypothetical protein n=1 Tax=Tetraodon nigroviridis TaxID=99883 RepID=Q4SJU7_TETNG|nr:unnamed protein product [Tetraodon nigroviridis]
MLMWESLSCAVIPAVTPSGPWGHVTSRWAEGPAPGPPGLLGGPKREELCVPVLQLAAGSPAEVCRNNLCGSWGPRSSWPRSGGRLWGPGGSSPRRSSVPQRRGRSATRLLCKCV